MELWNLDQSENYWDPSKMLFNRSKNICLLKFGWRSIVIPIIRLVSRQGIFIYPLGNFWKKILCHQFLLRKIWSSKIFSCYSPKAGRDWFCSWVVHIDFFYCHFINRITSISTISFHIFLIVSYSDFNWCVKPTIFTASVREV